MTTNNGEGAAADLKLADFMCFAIYSANLAYGRAYRPILEALGLTYTQYITIVALAEREHETVSSLGEMLLLESNTLTPVLKKLEATGYVRRERDPADERQVLVSLTTAGKDLHRRSLSVNLVAATGLTPEELANVQRTVSKLRDNLLSESSKNGSN